MTWDEFIAWDVEGHAEWVNGEGFVYASTTDRHANVVYFLLALLDRFVRIHGLGQAQGKGLAMRLNPAHRPSGRMPDVIVLDHAGIARLRPNWLDGPSLLVVEVVSPDSPSRDYVVKRGEYERAGVAEYLIVEGREGHSGVTWLRLADHGQYRDIAPDARGRIHSVVLPGFWLDPVWLDEDPLPNVDRLVYRMDPDLYRRYQESTVGE